jgi:Ig-like domain-containing protein
MTVRARRGRPRKSVPLHLVVMRELSNAMRQARVSAGLERLDAAREVVNDAIRDLYPEATERVRTGRGQPSGAHLVTTKYISDVERGNTSKSETPAWLSGLEGIDAERLRGSRVPAWLVRAYDLAFLADGYLIDLYAWAVATDRDHRSDPPRLARALDGLLAASSFDLPDQPAEVAAVVDADRVALARLAAVPPGDWLPADGDRSAAFGDGEEDNPEGVLLRPGEYRLPRWVMRNTGDVAWADRVLYRVGATPAGIASPVAVPVPPASPGDTVELTVPVRAPDRAGTYRMCLKMGWPDGTYCFPNTLVGLILTVVVPDPALPAVYDPW